MANQLRTYTINRGKMDEFVRAWREGVVPLRRKAGFTISGGWIIRETNQFIWIASYDGPKTWKEVEDAYYALPERKELDPDPASFIARMELHFVEMAI